MLCGLGVPSLRSLWGAVRNHQLYILRMYCKGCISFNFSIFFIIYMTYHKKKLTRPYRKKKFNFFSNSHDLPQKKITRICRKKNYTTRQLFCTRLTFFTAGTYQIFLFPLLCKCIGANKERGQPNLGFDFGETTVWHQHLTFVHSQFMHSQQNLSTSAHPPTCTAQLTQ